MHRKHLNSLAVVSAIAAIFASWLRLDTAFVLLKPITTILIILIPVLYHTVNTRILASLIVVALLACLAGDVFLLCEAYFVQGLGVFLLAHMMFAIIFFFLSGRKFYPLPLLILLLFGAAFYRLLLPALGELSIPVAIYIACIMLMCWQAVSTWLSRGDRTGRRVAVAAVLFVFSDSIIAVNKFLLPFELSNAVILSSYWLSIAIIANLAADSKIQFPATGK